MKTIFEKGDIVSIVPRLRKERIIGYITEDFKVRSPFPLYETNLFNDSMLMVKKQGWKN